MKLVKWAALTLALIIVLALAGLGATLLLNPKMAAELAKRPASLAQVASENAAGEKTAGPAKDPTPPAGLTFSKRLAEAGVKSCLSLIDDLGKGVMGGVANFVPASNWDIDAPDQHIASVFLGQKYSNAKLPFGFASLFGAPPAAAAAATASPCKSCRTRSIARRCNKTFCSAVNCWVVSRACHSSKTSPARLLWSQPAPIAA